MDAVNRELVNVQNKEYEVEDTPEQNGENVQALSKSDENSENYPTGVILDTPPRVPLRECFLKVFDPLYLQSPAKCSDDTQLLNPSSEINVIEFDDKLDCSTDERNSENDNNLSNSSNNTIIFKDGKGMDETIKQLRASEAKLVSDFNAKYREFKYVMDEFDKTISKSVSAHKKLKVEHDTVKQHLATLEIAFADVLQKYERSKTIINGYETNEQTLRQNREELVDDIKKRDERYELLKAHAKTQIEKGNKEFILAREQYEMEIAKLHAIIKRIEIKTASLVVALDQKTTECTALAALCDEVTGKV